MNLEIDVTATGIVLRRVSSAGSQIEERFDTDSDGLLHAVATIRRELEDRNDGMGVRARVQDPDTAQRLKRAIDADPSGGEGLQALGQQL